MTDSPSFKDYQSKEKDYVLLYYENEIDSKEKHDFQMIRQFAKYNLQSIESPFSEPVYERQYPDGYVGVFINYLEESTDVSVNATNLRMESIGAALISQNGKKSPAELIAIACEFADNVEINGEKGKPLGSGHPQITDGFGTMPAKTESVKPASKSAPQTKTKAPAKTATTPV